jgi:flagellin-like protein
MSITLLNYEERYKTMSTTTIQKRRAVSPVIATVILIAVAVALGIAVAFWASGLTSSFSKYEKLGVNTQYATLCTTSSPCQDGNSTGWEVILGGQNTGSSDASIIQIQVNGVPINLKELESPNGAPLLSPVSVRSGATFSLAFNLPKASGSSSQTFSSGQTVQVTIITAAGNNYPASIVLP